MAIIAFMIFTPLIFGLIFNNAVENAKLEKEAMAMIYITDIFEKIGEKSYEYVTETQILAKLVSTEVRNKYHVEVNVQDIFKNSNNYEDIVKRITITLSYQVNGEIYSVTMKRIKGKV